MKIKALQLPWHSAFQSTFGKVWHRTWVPQRLSAACATQLSAGPLGGTKRMIDNEDSNANGARGGATALVTPLCVEISCGNVRSMRSNTVQQRSVVVVVVREDRAG